MTLPTCTLGNTPTDMLVLHHHYHLDFDIVAHPIFKHANILNTFTIPYVWFATTDIRL